MNKKRLIVNADDFGQSEGVNAGIIKAFENGILTSASMMVRYPAAIQAAAFARKNHTLGVGLHFDLGEWICLDGNWITLYEMVSLDDTTSVTDEIKTQLDIFYRIMGKKPTHIDSHQHVHQKESIRPILIEIAHKLNVTLRGFSKKVNYCGEFYGQSANGAPFHEAISIDSLKRIITKIPVGITELACHPGLDKNLKTMYLIEREMELVSLCDPGLQKIIADSEIELCTFDGITF